MLNLSGEWTGVLSLIRVHKKFILFFSFLLLLSILGVRFHYHENGMTHDTCSLCSFASHHNNFVFQDSDSCPITNL